MRVHWSPRHWRRRFLVELRLKGCVRCRDLEDLTGSLEKCNLARSVHRGRSSGVRRLTATMAIWECGMYIAVLTAGTCFSTLYLKRRICFSIIQRLIMLTNHR